MARERLFDVEAKERWTGSKALVPLPDDACPSCGGETRHGDRRPAALAAAWRIRRGGAHVDAALPVRVADAVGTKRGQAVTEPRYVIQRDNAHGQWAVIDRLTLEVVQEFDRMWQAELWITSEPEVIDLDDVGTEVKP